MTTDFRTRCRAGGAQQVAWFEMAKSTSLPCLPQSFLHSAVSLRIQFVSDIGHSDTRVLSGRQLHCDRLLSVTHTGDHFLSIVGHTSTWKTTGGRRTGAGGLGFLHRELHALVNCQACWHTPIVSAIQEVEVGSWSEAGPSKSTRSYLEKKKRPKQKGIEVCLK
jgi:hypothetical protein